MITKYPLPISFARCFGQSLKGSLRSWIFWAIQVPLKQPIPRRWKNSKSGGEPVYSWAISICAWWCSLILSWGDFQTLGRRHTFSSKTWGSAQVISYIIKVARFTNIFCANYDWVCQNWSFQLKPPFLETYILFHKRLHICCISLLRSHWLALASTGITGTYYHSRWISASIDLASLCKLSDFEIQV